MRYSCGRSPLSELQVFEVVCAAPALWYDVIDGEVAEREHHLVSGEEDVLALVVVDRGLDVRATALTLAWTYSGLEEQLSSWDEPVLSGIGD